MTEPESPSDSRRVLSFWDAVSLILGMVIGTSIFRSPSSIFSNMPGVGSTLLLWGVGGILSLVGALCYAELAAAWPERGGDVIIVPSLSDEAAKEKFPGGWKTLKPYLRVVPQPKA